MLSGASGVTFCPMFGLSPAPLITSDFTASTRSLPPSAVAASLTICISGGTREHALATATNAHANNRPCFIILYQPSGEYGSAARACQARLVIVSVAFVEEFTT